eukprot:TRINITY_DN2268_c0_g1_i1.p1 TRINITY_DN2268_c0_g1~~TRINITY_DN2268_c0_g1_i1.p1  ORF type:complete len:234 (-),score=1.71 TRINITY_DN2268_c0_g1_i1:301-1002(-)
MQHNSNRYSQVTSRNRLKQSPKNHDQKLFRTHKNPAHDLINGKTVQIISTQIGNSSTFYFLIYIPTLFQFSPRLTIKLSSKSSSLNYLSKKLTFLLIYSFQQNQFLRLNETGGTSPGNARFKFQFQLFCYYYCQQNISYYSQPQQLSQFQYYCQFQFYYQQLCFQFPFFADLNKAENKEIENFRTGEKNNNDNGKINEMGSSPKISKTITGKISKPSPPKIYPNVILFSSNSN